MNEQETGSISDPELTQVRSADVHGWQPIETAPKDGTKILVFTHHGDIELSEWFGWDNYDYQPIGDGDTFRRVVAHRTEGWNSSGFTHWQPLPAPPETTP